MPLINHLELTGKRLTGNHEKLKANIKAFEEKVLLGVDVRRIPRDTV
jgi:hypothetical protein